MKDKIIIPLSKKEAASIIGGGFWKDMGKSAHEVYNACVKEIKSWFE